MDWIRSCRVIISVVGLGCHIAELYGVPTVILSGPTAYQEAQNHSKGTVLLPPTPCEYRPCHLPSGVANCGCMEDFIPATIAQEGERLLDTI